jgi:hypothetical protein
LFYLAQSRILGLQVFLTLAPAVNKSLTTICLAGGASERQPDNVAIDIDGFGYPHPLSPLATLMNPRRRIQDDSITKLLCCPM